jgi:hypothetical protein
MLLRVFLTAAGELFAGSSGKAIRNGGKDMKFSNRLVTLSLLALFATSPGQAQTNTQGTGSKVEADAQRQNVQAYIELLRENVGQQKDEIMGVVMLLSAEDAKKFWPIYNEYDAQLAKLNGQRLENIQEYARNYNQLTDAKADELIQKSVAYQKQRLELLLATYDKVKQVLGGVTAARFAQVENQLLLIIDLEMTSLLPVAGQGS